MSCVADGGPHGQRLCSEVVGRDKPFVEDEMMRRRLAEDALPAHLRRSQLADSIPARDVEDEESRPGEVREQDRAMDGLTLRRGGAHCPEPARSTLPLGGKPRPELSD